MDPINKGTTDKSDVKRFSYGKSSVSLLKPDDEASELSNEQEGNKQSEAASSDSVRGDNDGMKSIISQKVELPSTGTSVNLLSDQESPPGAEVQEKESEHSIEKNAENEPDKESEKELEHDNEKKSGKELEHDNEKKSGKELEKDLGKNSEKGLDKEFEKDNVEKCGRIDTIKTPPGKNKEKSARKHSSSKNPNQDATPKLERKKKSRKKSGDDDKRSTPAASPLPDKKKSSKSKSKGEKTGNDTKNEEKIIDVAPESPEKHFTHIKEDSLYASGIDLSRYLTMNDFSHSVDIKVNDTKFECSGIILAYHSSYFEYYLSQGARIITLDGIKCPVGKEGMIEECLQMLHGAGIILTDSNIEIVVRFAVLYRVENMYRLALEWVRNCISVRNVYPLWCLAQEKPVLDKVKKKKNDLAYQCRTFLKNNEVEIAYELRRIKSQGKEIKEDFLFLMLKNTDCTSTITDLL